MSAENKERRPRRVPTPEEREYKKFRTGYTYHEVSDMLWYSDPWHCAHHTRRRHSVLGKWREIKREMWDHYQHMQRTEVELPVHVEPDNGVPF